MRSLLLLLLISLHMPPCGWADDFALFSVDGYRLQSYRSATPAAVEGGTTLSVAAAHLLWASDQALFVNVQPVLWRHGAFIVRKPLSVIPHSVWLPNVGFGELDPLWEAYLQHHIAHRQGKVVFYCTPDCWHSWNTAKRVKQSWPWLDVYWFRDGIDAWQEAGFPVSQTQTPLPLPLK